MTTEAKRYTKLIEVALPLPEVNDASAYDKMPGIGPHPKGIHQWWARLPLPTARAVLFASVVDDPGSHPEKWATETAQNVERERLFDIIRKMMGKKLHESSELYAQVRQEMLRHVDGVLPSVFDPFAGGGTIPLEANRLGFETHAADLNPVAVLLNKCNLEIAPTWNGYAPINPEDRRRIDSDRTWHGLRGLASDIRYYGEVIGKRAVKKLGVHYPAVSLPQEIGGGKTAVVAWIWARTVPSPSPAAQAKEVPLISTYWLSNKKKGETWLSPKVDKVVGAYCFDVNRGAPTDKKVISAGTKIGRGAKFRCLLTNDPIDEAHVRSEARSGRMGKRLIAVVAQGKRGKIYLPAECSGEVPAPELPSDYPSEELTYDSRYLTPPAYGMTSVDKLFTRRQLVSLVTLSDLVAAILPEVRRDAEAAGLNAEKAREYSKAVITFLALAVDRCCDFNNTLCRWSPSNEKVMNLFGRQAISMIWDFAEANIMGEAVGSWSTCSAYVADCIEALVIGDERIGHVKQIDAATGANGIENLLVSADPPYYDNVPYADISDFFYVWLRRTMSHIDSELFSTVLVPKIPELTASPQRFGGNKDKAREHFETGFRNAFTALRDKMDRRFPLTVYYAFKQEDEEAGPEGNEAASPVDLTTGWETLLAALISSGFQVTATWPVRASQAWRMRAMGSNALASYIVLACRPRPVDAPRTDRRTFAAELKGALPAALRHLQQGNIAPVDFAQAAIGPGMGIYSRYSQVLESTGKPLTIRAALLLINQILTEVLSEQEDEFDPETRWAVAWFEQHGFGEGEFGAAEILSKAKVTSITALQHAGFVSSKGGKVRLLRPEELSKKWDPSDKRQVVWEMTHQLVRTYYCDKLGEVATADIVGQLGSGKELARDLAYRLFNVCERKKWAQEAQGYNALVLGWPEITRLARERATAQQQPKQTEMYA